MLDVSSSERNYNDIQMKIYAFNQILEKKNKYDNNQNWKKYGNEFITLKMDIFSV